MANSTRQDETQTRGTFDLTSEQKANLLDCARTALAQAARKEKVDLVAPRDPELQRPVAVFVTLWQDSPNASEPPLLRGCIGRIEADLPLYQAVLKAANGAATRDPRFAPVSGVELPTLEIEITLLSPLSEVHSLDEIVLGRDGLVIEAYGRRALLLPKVALRQGWTKTELLQSLCAKAGLSRDTWPGAGSLYCFTTTEFCGRFSKIQSSTGGAELPTEANEELV